MPNQTASTLILHSYQLVRRPFKCPIIQQALLFYIVTNLQDVHYNAQSNSKYSYFAQLPTCQTPIQMPHHTASTLILHSYQLVRRPLKCPHQTASTLILYSYQLARRPLKCPIIQQVVVFLRSQWFGTAIKFCQGVIGSSRLPFFSTIQMMTPPPFRKMLLGEE